MAIYAVGDIQGCLDPLQRLLDAVSFDPATDSLWLTGDLVNRGPDSLDVLRFVRELGEHAKTVLGNHDLHLLAVAQAGYAQKRRDTLTPVLDAPDRDELIDWLRRQPMAIYDHDMLMVHAGLAPQWTLEKTMECAAEVQNVLRSPGFFEFLQQMYGDTPDVWDDALTGMPRLRCIVNYLTRVRYCDATGRMCLSAKGAPGSQAKGQIPWFRVPERASRELTVVFGHWSTLGLVDDPGIISLDTGCVWGGRLTARRVLPPGEFTSVSCGQNKSSE